MLKKKYQIIQGNNLDVLRSMPDSIVHCVVCSPPYYPSIRNYNVEKTEFRDGWKGCLGDEPDPFLFINHLVEVFSEVKRVLRDDGVFWLNIGDSFCKHNKWKDKGIVKKSLIGVPWRLAFALQEDGWILRNDNHWHKPNPIPESVNDRFTRCHEYIFQFSKTEKYFFDTQSVREKASESSLKRIQQKNFHNQTGGDKDYGKNGVNDSRSARKTLENFAKNPGRNKRNVFEIPVASFKGSHFAVFPEELPVTLIKASTSQQGVCEYCGSQYIRDLNKHRFPTRPGNKNKIDCSGKSFRDPRRHCTITTTKGWIKPCDCESKEIDRPIVLDPFNGAGTTGVAAIKQNCHYIGIELNKDYVDISRKRIRDIDQIFSKEGDVV